MDPKSEYVPLMLREHHDVMSAGHSSTLKTLHGLKRVCYWRGMKKSVYDYVKACGICQDKSETISPAGLLQPYLFQRRFGRNIYGFHRGVAR